jgi:hypothetical protein
MSSSIKSSATDRLRVIEGKIRILWWLSPFVVIGVVTLWFAIGNIPLNSARKSVPDTDVYSRAGTHGDSYGMANSLFSALAFAAIAYTLCLQQLEIRQQHEEMRLATEQYTASAEAQAQMEKTQLLAAYLASLDSQSRIVATRIARDGVNSLMSEIPRRELSILMLTDLQVFDGVSRLTNVLLRELLRRFPEFSDLSDRQGVSDVLFALIRTGFALRSVASEWARSILEKEGLDQRVRRLKPLVEGLQSTVPTDGRFWEMLPDDSSIQLRSVLNDFQSSLETVVESAGEAAGTGAVLILSELSDQCFRGCRINESRILQEQWRGRDCPGSS